MSVPVRRHDQIPTLPPPEGGEAYDDVSGVVTGPLMPRGIKFIGALGAGSIGTVVAGMVDGTDQLVAVKMLSPDYRAEEEQRERLFAEAIAASRLTSPHVAKVLRTGELPDGAPYVVMEYLKGETLDNVLRKRGPLPAALAVECVVQALDALAEAHSLGLVHRDVKPSNIFLCETPDGSPHVKVLDFGIVKDLLATKVFGRITRDGNIVGTPAYMAPEQLDDRPDIDERADIWSTGATLYELLTGDVPFTSRSIPELLAAIKRDAAPRLRNRRPDVSERLERIVARCLAKRREDRPWSAAELAVALGAEIF